MELSLYGAGIHVFFPALFFDPATKKTVVAGSQADTVPFGGAAAVVINNNSNNNNNVDTGATCAAAAVTGKLAYDLLLHQLIILCSHSNRRCRSRNRNPSRGRQH